MDINIDTLNSEGWKYNCYEYIFSSPQDEWYEKTYIKNGITFYLEIRSQSNTVGRDFYVHVDNSDHDTVAALDVKTFEQIDKLLELLIEE